MICEGFNFSKRASGMFQSCVQNGSYGLRECAHAVGSVIDIGANVGFFSVAARMLCSDARIISLEPDESIYAQLVSNAKHLRIGTVRAGLGDGKPLRLVAKHARERGCYGVRYEQDGNGPAVRSVALPQIVSTFGIAPAGLFLKIDCEGAEHYLVGNSEAENIMRQSVGIGGEFHPAPEGVAQPNYKEWLTDILSATHAVTFATLFRSGIREFKAIRKELAQNEHPTSQVAVRFLRKCRMKDKPVYNAGESFSFEWEFACHLVHCDYAEFVL